MDAIRLLDGTEIPVPREIAAQGARTAEEHAEAFDAFVAQAHDEAGLGAAYQENRAIAAQYVKQRAAAKPEETEEESRTIAIAIVRGLMLPAPDAPPAQE